MSGQGAISQTGMRQFGTSGRKRNPYGGYSGTGYSTALNGRVTVDPSIRAIQDEGLSRTKSMYGDAGAYGDELIGNTRSLRERFIGNNSAYADSQLNPLRQQMATRRGEIQQNIGLRGMSGSSFGEQALTNYETDSQRALQDASSKVEFDQLQALTGIDAQLTQQMFGKISTQAMINGESLDIAKQRFAQEMQALGLGQAQQQALLGAFDSYQQREMAGSPHDTGFATSGGGGVGGGGGGGGGSG